MAFKLTIALCICNAVLAIIAFALYVRARLATRESAPGIPEDTHNRRVAALDRLERRYLSFHFITLWLFVLFGVLILIQLSNRLNGNGPTL